MLITRHATGETVTGARILEIVRSSRVVAIIAAAKNEGYVIVGHPDPLPKAGDFGDLVFTDGGPYGGYWHFHPRANAEAPA